MEKSYLKITILSVCLDSGHVQCFCMSSIFCGFCALFIGSASTFSQKNKFKTGSHGTIYTFKNYFVIVFLVINSIQTDFKSLII